MNNKTKSILIGLSFLTSGIVSGQNIKDFKTQVKKDLIENFQTTKKNNSDKTISYISSQDKLHENIINTSFDDIIKKYGKIKGIEIIKTHFLIELNKERAKNGAGPMKINNVLNQLSQEHSGDMAINNYFNHVNKKGKSATQRVEGKYFYSVFGENIYFNEENIKHIMIGYKNRKKGHHKIFEKSYKEIGIGISKSKDGYYYITNDYGTELNTQIKKK
ncbi:MAG: CAP domain-containing protein [Candidatus Absconditabacterales bacterium]